MATGQASTRSASAPGPRRLRQLARAAGSWDPAATVTRQRRTGGPSLPALEPYTRRLLRHVRPIIVANRAPLVLEAADPIRGGPERLVKGGGGLVTALSSLAAATGALWVAAARDEQDRRLAERGDP